MNEKNIYIGCGIVSSISLMIVLVLSTGGF